MKTILLVFLLSLTFCIEPESDNLKKIAEKVNAMHTTWTAQVYDRDFSVYLGSFGSLKEEIPEREIQVRDDLPESYDFRLAYPKCEAVNKDRDQSECGSCWAFGATTSLEERFCLHSGGDIKVTLAPQDPVSCDELDMG